MPKGKKTCPNCSTEAGVRTKACTSCGHAFAFKTAAVKAPKVQEMPSAPVDSQPAQALESTGD